MQTLTQKNETHKSGLRYLAPYSLTANNDFYASTMGSGNSYQSIG